MVWPAIIIGIFVIWYLWDRRQDDLYPPGMREEKALEKRQKKETIVRMKKAMNNPKYYEEMKHFDPTFTVPSGTWKETPEGKEFTLKKFVWMVVLFFLFFFLVSINSGSIK